MTLSESLLADDRRPAVVADLVEVVNTEVSAKSGLSGAAIKTAYAAVKKVGPTVVPGAINSMLPEIASALEPFWAQRGGDFGADLSADGDAAADALLTVTDRRASSTSREPLKRAYNSLRPKAKTNVIAALPRLGAAIQKHAA